VVTACITAAGVHAGRALVRLRMLPMVADILGGLVLIAIGISILLEHG
jgi:putative Mn2+ efflux pump MntP